MHPDWRVNMSVKRPPEFMPGNNFVCGHHVVIQEGVQIGNNVEVGNFVLLKKGTVIEDNVFFDSYCISSGSNRIGAGSKIRYQSIIARNVEIGKNVFFCAGVKTAYLTHERNQQPEKMVIGDNVFVGDNATILSGLTIAAGVVIGAHALVTRDCVKPNAIYAGLPAKHVRSLTEEEFNAIHENIRQV